MREIQSMKRSDQAFVERLALAPGISTPPRIYIPPDPLVASHFSFHHRKPCYIGATSSRVPLNFQCHILRGSETSNMNKAVKPLNISWLMADSLVGASVVDVERKVVQQWKGRRVVW